MVDSDISKHAGPGPAVSTVGVNGSGPYHHRVLPYFKRQSTGTPFKLRLECRHPQGSGVSYQVTSSQSRADRWQKVFQLPSGATKKHGYYQTRQLDVPTVAVAQDAQIECTFRIHQRRDLRTQTWIDVPDDDGLVDRCVLEYTLEP